MTSLLTVKTLGEDILEEILEVKDLRGIEINQDHNQGQEGLEK